MALNGGVSLAVWMGGCAVELDCARRARWGPEDQAYDAVRGGALPAAEQRDDRENPVSERTVYHALCEAFRRELVIDIMSGASAGGINGGLLAGAMVSGRRLHPKYLRDRWLSLGDFSQLLHSPTDSTPRSLLQGQHFIDSLVEVFEVLMGDEADAMSNGLVIPSRQVVPAPQVPPHLDVTVTDVRGTERTYRDTWGGIFSAREYRRRFSFREKDDFTAENLAVAARCSASFPAAFEPFRPNADSWILTARAGLKPSGEGPPWTIDGGLLDNAPIRAAIDLIPTRPAERQVKRYLVYVNPEPHEPLDPGAATAGTNADGKTDCDEPELADVAAYVINLPRKLPFVDQLDAIEDAVERSSLAEAGTLSLLRAPLDTLEGAAEALLPAYTSRRRLKSLRELLDDPAAAERGFLALEETCADLPWIPRSLALSDPVRWEWGLSTAIRICHFLLDLIRMGMPKGGDPLTRFLDARKRLGETLAALQAAFAGAEVDQELLQELRSERPKLSVEERAAGLQGLAGDQDGTALHAVRSAIRIFANLVDSLEGDELTLAPSRERLGGKAGCHDAAQDRVEVGVALLGEGWRDDAVFGDMRKNSSCERPDRALTGPERCALRRLLAIEVLRRAYTAEEQVESAQELAFVQLTPDAPAPIFAANPLKAPPVSAETKLTGIRLGHFAGFLKRSWRANDFMWGRLDAAARIVDLLVDPDRAHALGCDKVAGELTESLLRDAALEQRWLLGEALQMLGTGGARKPPTAEQLSTPLKARIRAELEAHDGDASFTRMVFTRAAQLEIVRAELPAIAAATRKDAADGSATKPIDFGEADERTRELPTGGVLQDAIAKVRVGPETLPMRLGRDDPAETTSDLTARMAAQAGFVTLAALRTAKLPAAQALNVLRPPLLAVSGVVAKGFPLRIPLVLGFWAAALYLTARVVGSSQPADLGLVDFNEVLLALVALLTVVGVAVLPFVRWLRRRREPVAIGEFGAALSMILAGGGAAIVLALIFGGLSPAQLVVGNGFDKPPDAVLDVTIAIALGLPLARTTLLRRAPSWLLDLSKGGGVSAGLIGAVAILVSVWTVQTLIHAIGEGHAWSTIAALIALILPWTVCLEYILLHTAPRDSKPR